jgi:hypothetical protein
MFPKLYAEKGKTNVLVFAKWLLHLLYLRSLRVHELQKVQKANMIRKGLVVVAPSRCL